MLIDPWNAIDPEVPSDMSLTIYVGEAIKAMKRCARKLQVLWIVIVHPSKIKQGDTIGLYSISDSAHWFNKSDVGIVISRPADDGDAELRVAKARYEEIGRRGCVKMRFNPETRRFQVPVELFTSEGACGSRRPVVSSGIAEQYDRDEKGRRAAGGRRDK